MTEEGYIKHLLEVDYIMMRSMFSGVSGLRAHQLKMDVIGNNIANVNTVGFKGQRATFQEVFSQTIKGAGSPQLGRGGTNPQQIGLGISLSSIDTFHVRGAVQRTDNNTDLAINGDGFFILSNSNDFLSRAYTRAGNFTLDEDGNLVASNGYRVLGYMEDESKNTGSDKPVLKGVMEGLTISKSKSFPAMATDKATFTGNLNNNLTKIEDGVDIGDSYTKKGESNPFATLEFPPGVEYRETTSTFYDSLGGQHNIKFIFVRGLQANGTGGGGDNQWGVIVQNLETGTFFNTDGTAADEPDADSMVVPILFKSDGTLEIDDTDYARNLVLNIPGKNGSEDFDVTVDLTELTAFSNESSASVSTKNGYKQGYLDTFSIGPTGEIYGIFTNGQSRVIGQIALAAFKNPAGLEKTSENMYQVTPNSGDAIYGLPGSSGLGALNPGTLEMSNVDISREFTEMISTQRGFQANSRIITTSDEMLQELVNMKR
jgi:flagellar hook protein FlgE